MMKNVWKSNLILLTKWQKFLAWLLTRDFDISFSDILLDEKLYENILFCDISYKTSTDPKLLRIRLDKMDGFIWVRGGEFRYLVLFDRGLFDKNC